MRAVISKVTEASVTLEDGTVTGRIGPGLLVLLGVTHEDGPADVELAARKIAGVRIFDDQGPTDVGAEILVVSQFTLYGSIKKGRRPSYTDAAGGRAAEPLYEAVVAELRQKHGLTVETGKFGAAMKVASVGDGPVTILLET